MTKILLSFAFICICAMIVLKSAAKSDPENSEILHLFEEPLPPPGGPLKVFHLGHSLVGRDMPFMVSQMAGAGHVYHSQLGWGTRLKGHWGPKSNIKGFEEENNHFAYRDIREALLSGDYDALVLTEGVEIRDSIKYGASSDFLAKWVDLARSSRPDIRVYLYETWHWLNDSEGWLERIDRDLERYWENEILLPAIKASDPQLPIFVIPAGQVLARFVRTIENQGGVGALKDRHDLFKVKPDGTQDNIHFNDYGAYLVALTHYSVLYGVSPIGMPNSLQLADGSLAKAPGPEAAELMQEIVHDTVSTYPLTGVQF